MIYNEVAAPTSFPITLQQVKAWTRVDDSTSDAELAGLIQAATLIAENFCNRPLIARQVTAKMSCFPPVIRLNKLPVQTVDSITYLDTDGATQTLATSVYQVSLGNDFSPAIILPAYAQNWPSIRAQMDSVTVTFTAGYSTWNYVPESIRQGIAYLVEQYWADRSVMIEGGQMNPLVMALFNAHRIYSL